MITQSPGKLVRRKPQSQPAPAPQPVLVRRRQEKKTVLDSRLPRRLVPIEERQDGWPYLDPDETPDTLYEVVGNNVVGFTTDCNGLHVGWDMCGLCCQHVIHCRCHGVKPPRGVVYCYRAAHKIEYPTGVRGGYIGLRHNTDGSVAPLIFDSPLARMDADLPAPEAPPTTRPLTRRRPQAATQAPAPRTRNVQGKAEQVSSKLVRRTPTRKG